MSHALALLVVDDSAAQRLLMEITLGAAFPEAQVLTTGYPAQAKAMCEDTRFDCVLVDYNLPEMDGLTLARQLMEADDYLATVVMTGVGDEMLAAEALRSGVSDYVPKGDITAESIERIVRRSIVACSQARLIDEQRMELETFAYAVAHHIKRPIRQISTFSMLIADQLRDVRAGEIQRHLAFLSDAASRLGKMVDAASRYSAHDQQPALADVRLGRRVEATRSPLGPLASNAGIGRSIAASSGIARLPAKFARLDAESLVEPAREAGGAGKSGQPHDGREGLVAPGQRIGRDLAARSVQQ
jgi:CheY-like chemotaxis protein